MTRSIPQPNLWLRKSFFILIYVNFLVLFVFDMEVEQFFCKEPDETFEINYILDCDFNDSTNIQSKLSILSSNNNISIYDQSFSLQNEKQLQFKVVAVAVSQRNVWIAGENGQIAGYDLEYFALLAETDLSMHLASAAISTDSGLLAVGTGKLTDTEENDDTDSDEEPETHGSVIFHNLKTNEKLKLLGTYDQCHNDAVNVLKFQPDSHDWLASGGADGLVNVFDLREQNEDDALHQTLNLESSVNRIGWSYLEGNWRIYGVSDDNKLAIWDMQSGDELMRHSFNDHFLVDCFSTNSAIYPITSESEGKIHFHFWKQGAKLKTVATVDSDHSEMVRTMVWHKTSQILVTAGEDGRIVAFRVKFVDTLLKKQTAKQRKLNKRKKPY